MICHGVYVPSQYPEIAKMGLIQTLSDKFAYSTAIPGPAHGIKQLGPMGSHITDTDSLIIAQDITVETVYRSSDESMIENLAAIRAQNPERKIAVFFNGRRPDDLRLIRATPLFNAAVACPHIDLIYADLPMQQFAVPPFNFLESMRQKHFKTIMQTMLAGECDTPMRSPELVDDPQKQTVTLGDLVIDRENNTATFTDGQPAPLTKIESAVLGVLAAYQNSWVPTPLLMTELRTQGIKSVADERGLNTPIRNMKNKLATLGLGAPRTLRGIGRYVRPGEFQRSNAAFTPA